MKRRTFIIAVPAATLALAGTPDASPDTRLHTLMLAWRTQYEICSLAESNADVDATSKVLRDIERAVASITPQTAEGFSIKLLVLTSFGDFGFDGMAAGLLLEAQALCGFGPPASHQSFSTAAPDPMLCAVRRKQELEALVNQRGNGLSDDAGDQLINEACDGVVGVEATTMEGVMAALDELEMDLVEICDYTDPGDHIMGLLRGAKAGLLRLT